MPTYFTPIPDDPNQAADADTFNDPMLELDAGIGIAYARGDDALSIATANNSELVAARAPYPSLSDRLDAFVVAGGNLATKANGVSAAGQKVLTVDDPTGFIVGSYVTYLLNNTTLEGNVIASIQAGVSITLVTNIGTGGVLDDTPISMISISEYLAAQAIPHAGTLLLPDTMAYVNAGQFNVLAYGAAGDGSTDDTAAIQTAIDAAMVSGGIVTLPAGRYKITAALDLCNTKNVKLQGAGASYPAESTGTIIDCHNAGGAAIEIIGSHAIEIADLTIEGDASNTPAVGVWTGRSTESGGTNTSFIMFNRVNWYGAFTIAAVYNTGCESNIFHSCYVFVTNAACLAGLMWDWQNTSGTGDTDNDLTPEHTTLDTQFVQAMCAVYDSLLTCSNAAVAYSPVYIVNETVPIQFTNTYVVAYGAPCYYMLGAGSIDVKGDAVEGTTPTYVIHGDYLAGASNNFKIMMSNCGGMDGSAGASIYFDDNTTVVNSIIENCSYSGDLRFYDIVGSRIEHWCDYSASIDAQLIVTHQSVECYFEIGYEDTYSNANPFTTTLRYNTSNTNGYSLLPGLAVDSGVPGVAGQAVIRRILTASATWNPGSLADGASASTTVSLTGIVQADPWICSAHFAGISGYDGWSISAIAGDGAIGVTIINRSGGVIDPSSGTLTVMAMKVEET